MILCFSQTCVGELSQSDVIVFYKQYTNDVTSRWNSPVVILKHSDRQENSIYQHLAMTAVAH
mgnify:CR=1 FL=1